MLALESLKSSVVCDALSRGGSTLCELSRLRPDDAAKKIR
jgi:hypothetical protein